MTNRHKPKPLGSVPSGDISKPAVFDPSDPAYPVPKGESAVAIMYIMLARQHELFGESFTFKKGNTKTILIRNIKLLLNDYSANEIKRAIEACLAVTQHPFSTKMVKEKLEEWN